MLRCKATYARHVLPILRQVLLKCVERTSEHAVLRFQCLNGLYLCYHEMEQWTDQSRRRLAEFSRRHLQLFVQLHVTTRDVDYLKWHCLPKHHLFIHCCEDNNGVNPRTVWNYSYETEIGTCIRSAQASNGRHLGAAHIERYRQTYS